MSSMRRLSQLVASSACLVALGASAPAQGGGFTSGDLYLYSPAIQGISSNSGALVHVDLSAGLATILVDTESTPQSVGAMAFDPWRQRVLFCGAFPAQPFHLWATNAAGQLDDLGFTGKLVASFAPTGDGRVYLTDSADLSAPLKYLDAAGASKPLLNAAGTASYFINGLRTFNVRGMIYDAGTNALFVAAASPPCPGGLPSQVYVTKLPLSADGARVVGPETCAQFEVSPTSADVPAGWSRGPAGQLVLVADTNSAGVEPKILLVDPATLGISVFASPGGFFGDPAINAGTWSSNLSQVVVLETLTDVLRAYSAGSSGAGSTLAITGTVSAGGSSGETASLIEIPPSACTGGWLPYGAGLAGKGGAVPTLTGSGCPQIGGAFSLQLAHGVGSATGTLFVGLAPAAVPFKGGSFLVGAVVLQFTFGLGGPPSVADAGALTLPAGLPPDPALLGVSIYLQAGYQDPFAVKGVSLTQGLRMEIG